MVLLVCDAAGQTTDVFFVAGQSNASGRVTILQGQNGDFAPLAPSANDALVQYYYNTDGPAETKIRIRMAISSRSRRFQRPDTMGRKSVRDANW